MTMRRTREQKRAELLQAAEAVIEEYLDWEERTSKPNLTQIEDEVLKLRWRLGQRMAEVALADQEATQPVAAPACPTCGQPMRYKGQKALPVESRLGGLRVERGHYYCARCHSGLFPPGRPT
jgi:DNA repair exonuclease SbcCD ATPase subunit